MEIARRSNVIQLFADKVLDPEASTPGFFPAIHKVLCRSNRGFIHHPFCNVVCVQVDGLAAASGTVAELLLAAGAPY